MQEIREYLRLDEDLHFEELVYPSIWSPREATG